MIANGEYRAFEGLRSILDLALSEERDPKIESFFESNPGFCDNNPICIYRRKELEVLSEALDSKMAMIKEMDIEERKVYLILASKSYPGLL